MQFKIDCHIYFSKITECVNSNIIKHDIKTVFKYNHVKCYFYIINNSYLFAKNETIFKNILLL